MSSLSEEGNSCSESDTKDDAESVHDDGTGNSEGDENAEPQTSTGKFSELKDKEIETFDSGEGNDDSEIEENDVEKEKEHKKAKKEKSSDTEEEKNPRVKEIEKVKKAHPGVFDFSNDKDENEKMETDSLADQDEETADDGRISPPTTRKTRSKVAEDIKKTQEILAALPCVERLRPPNGGGGNGSTLSADKSETGEYASDRDSVYSGSQPRALRKKNKSDKVSKKGVLRKLNTRSAKGKGRRSLIKKKPVKSLSMTPTPITSQKIYYKGEYFSVGDIVSVTDESGDIYYGQLRGFLTDQFGDKSGVISWLLPTTGSPPPNEGFHPATYIIGPEEDIPRSMEVFTFVMHAPSDYFHNTKAPYKTSTLPPAGKGDIKIRRLGPRVIRTVDNKTVYVGIYS